MTRRRFNAETRDELLKYALAFVAVIVIAALLIVAQGEDPGVAIRALFQGAFGSTTAIGNAIRWSIPCIFTGLAASVAFKSGVLNLGIEGQLYFGALVSAALGYMVELPAPLHIALCLGAGILSGVIYALLPALMKLLLKLDEMITTLMLNYIAVLLTEYITIQLMGISAVANPLSVETPYIHGSATLPLFIGGTKANIGVFIGIAVAIAIVLVYKYTVKGYELKQVGENIRFARVGGVRTNATFIAIFLISGAIAGLCGSVEVMGSYKKFRAGFAGSIGWDGIMIARVAKNKPLTTVLVAFLWGIMKAGSLQMERMTNINRLTVTLIQAIFVLFITVDYSQIYNAVKNGAVRLGKSKS